jgi:hypothetical protein
LSEYELNPTICRLGVASARERALTLGAFSVLSALLANYFPELGLLNIFGPPLLPAVWFGLVLCAASMLWVSRKPFDLFVLLLASCLAWIAAYHVTVLVHDSIQSQFSQVAITPNIDPAQPDTVPPAPAIRTISYIDGVSGMIGGLIGSTIIVFGISIILPSFRAFGFWAQTILVGTLAGCLLELADPPLDGGVPFHLGTFLPMYLTWQIGVSSTIANNLTPRLNYPRPPERLTLEVTPPHTSPLATPYPATHASVASGLPSQTATSPAPDDSAATLSIKPSSPISDPTSTQKPSQVAFGFGIAALVFSILAIVFPFGIVLSLIAIALALIAALSGDKIFSIATALIALVNTFVLSPSTWILLSGDSSGFLKFGLAVLCLLPAVVVLVRAVRSTVTA